MGIYHLQPGDITHPAARPVAHGKEGRPTSISFLEQNNGLHSHFGAKNAIKAPLIPHVVMIA